MNAAVAIVTSPLFILHPPCRGAVTFQGRRCQPSGAASRRAAALMRFCLEPVSVAAALAAGFTASELQEGLRLGALLDASSCEYALAARWEHAGWSRAAHLMFSPGDEGQAEPPTPDQPNGPARQRIANDAHGADAAAGRSASTPVLVLRPGNVPSVFDPVVRRRTIRAFSSWSVGEELLGAVLFHASGSLRPTEQPMTARGGDAALRVYVVIQGVEGVAPGIYRYAPVEHALHGVASSPSPEVLAACVQHQWWITGGGWCCFLVADWERAMQLDRHPRGYMALLIRLGELAQEVLQAAYRRGLGGWVTVAVDEERAGRLLRLDSAREEAMYFLKIGYPDP